MSLLKTARQSRKQLQPDRQTDKQAKGHVTQRVCNKSVTMADEFKLKIKKPSIEEVDLVKNSVEIYIGWEAKMHIRRYVTFEGSFKKTHGPLKCFHLWHSYTRIERKVVDDSYKKPRIYRLLITALSYEIGSSSTKI